MVGWKRSGSQELQSLPLLRFTAKPDVGLAVPGNTKSLILRSMRYDIITDLIIRCASLWHVSLFPLSCGNEYLR